MGVTICHLCASERAIELRPKVSGRNSASEPAPASKQAFRTGRDADPRQRLVLQASPQSALESLFSRENPETRPHRIAVEGFVSSPLVQDT